MNEKEIEVRGTGYGAEGRKFFCFRFDGRRKRNKVGYPVPVCTARPGGFGSVVVSTTPRISTEIAHQVRYQERKAARQRKQKQIAAALLLKES